MKEKVYVTFEEKNVFPILFFSSKIVRHIFLAIQTNKTIFQVGIKFLVARPLKNAVFSAFLYP